MNESKEIPRRGNTEVIVLGNGLPAFIKIRAGEFQASLVGRDPSSFNLRGQELARKEAASEITPDEKAELMAMRRFPDDLHARELARKETLGEELTPDEQKELVALTRESLRNSLFR